MSVQAFLQQNRRPIDSIWATGLAPIYTALVAPTVLKRIGNGGEFMAEVSSQIIRVNEIEWSPMAPMVKAKMWWSDPGTKRRAQLTRFEPGATLPMHRHAGDELLFVIEGAISDEHGTTTSGNVGYRPNGCVHSVNSKNGATVLAIVSGGVEPADDRAGAPPSQNFNLSEIP